MKKFFVPLLLSVFLVWTSQVEANASKYLPLMPYPQSVEFQSGQLALTDSYYLTIEGMSEQRALFLHQRF